MPSDLGFPDDGFVLPHLEEHDHIIKVTAPPDGFLFQVPAIGLKGERDERRRTMKERCEFIAELVNHDRPAVVWCHLDEEGDTLEAMIPGAKQVAGKTPHDDKERIYEEFADGSLRCLVIKPKVGAWGLNWQHCNHVVTFASHSYEQYYQSVRRCYRFGQKRPVRLDVVATEGEERVLINMRAKKARAAIMFEALVREMKDAEKIERPNIYTNEIEVPQWL
jgi:superfamily II DNA/RNA helicase